MTTPHERIHGWQGHTYTIAVAEKGAPLVRSDVLAREAKARKAADKAAEALRLADEWQRKTQREADRQNSAYDHYGMGNTPETVDPLGSKMVAELRTQHARITELESQPAQRFGAADMATAAARGFGDGAASLAASVGSELVYQARYQKGFWQDSSRERYEYLQNPENTCAEDWETRILYTHPSPQEGMAGWISVDDSLPKCSRKQDSLGVEVLIWPLHEDGSCTAFYGRRQSKSPNFYKYGALLGHVQFWAYPPAPPASEAKGASHE